MKQKIKILNLLALICISLSCYKVNFNNPDDKYSEAYIRDNPKLSNIILSEGELSPIFDPDITEYSVNLTKLTSYINITPVAINQKSEILIDSKLIPSGSISVASNLSHGDNYIFLKITSEDLTETIEYKITISIFDLSFKSFRFLAAKNPVYLTEDTNGIIDENSASIIIDAPLYSDISNIITSFTVADTASVKIGQIQQISGLTENNFSSFLIYTIKDIIPSTGKTMSKNYTVSVKNGKWESYLKAPNSRCDVTNGVQFGYSVSVSEDTVAVGAPNERSSTTSIINGSDLSSTNHNGPDNGAVYVFNRNGSQWTHEAYLKAPNNAKDEIYGYNFGTSVSISIDTIAVGAPNECSSTTTIINGSDLSSTNTDARYSGAVYIYKKNNSIWTHEAYLKAINNSAGNSFGSSVSISGDTVAVGAPYENSTTTTIINGTDLTSTNNHGLYNGAVYVYKRTNNVWSHEAYLKAPNNDTYYVYFGNSISISNDTIAVGDRCENSSTTVIINGSDLSSANDDGSDNGAVYVFKRTGTIWSHEAYLKARNNSNHDDFGTSVSISGDTIAVGAPYEDSSTSTIINESDLNGTNDEGFSNGAVYVYKRAGSIWSFEAYLKAPNNSIGDLFGSSVAISSNIIAVGAPEEDSTTKTIIIGPDLSSTNNNGNNNGAVYIFKRDSNIWTSAGYIKAPNSAKNDKYGYSVSIFGNTIAVGSPFEHSPTTIIVNSPGSLPINPESDGYNWVDIFGAVYIFR